MLGNLPALLHQVAPLLSRLLHLLQQKPVEQIVVPVQQYPIDVVIEHMKVVIIQLAPRPMLYISAMLKPILTVKDIIAAAIFALLDR